MDHIIKQHLKGKQKRNYFTQEAEDAIIRYNNSNNSKEKSDIYEQYIHFPFFKLTQNIIHTFKFYYTEVENLEDLQHEIIIFLLTKIHLFNPENGAKAYSYFGTIVKRWLILYNDKNYKNKIKNITIEDLDTYSQALSPSSQFITSPNMENNVNKIKDNNKDNYDELGFMGYKENDKLFIFIDKYIEYCTTNIYSIFPKEYDAKIADSILELFRKRDSIDVFNKKALYIYIREMVEVKTPKITKIAKKLHVVFKEKYMVYLETGLFPS